MEEQCRDDIKARGIAQSPKWLWRQGQLGGRPPRRWTVRTTPRQILQSFHRPKLPCCPEPLPQIQCCAVRTIPRTPRNTLLILLFYVSLEPPIAVVSGSRVGGTPREAPKQTAQVGANKCVPRCVRRPEVALYMILHTTVAM